MGRVTEILSYRVKNTFVEIGGNRVEEPDYCRSRRAWSDASDVFKVPSPSLGTCPQPGTGQGLELGRGVESVGFVPDTPSPFLHPALLDNSVGQEVPPFSLAATGPLAFGEDMALPPAFGDGEGAFGMETSQSYDGPDIPGYYGLPAMMFDPSSGAFSMSGWCMPLDALGPGASLGEGEAEDCSILARGLPDMPMEASQELPLREALPDDQGLGSGWCVDGGLLLDPCGPVKDNLQDSQGWGPDGAMHLDQGGSLMEEGPMAWGPDGVPLEAQGWSVDGNLPVEQECAQQDSLEGSRRWMPDGASVLLDQGPEECQPPDAPTDVAGWVPEGEQARPLAAWRGKGGRGNRRQQPQEPDPVTPGGPGEAAAQGSSAEVQGSGCTTVMLRNIPNKYTREMLVKQLSQEFRGRFDFVYLPIDFKNRCNVGYGFINFRSVEACDEFVTKFNGVDVRKCLPGLNSRKVAEVTPARVQGLEENVRRLRNGPVMNELVHHPEWMPLLLDQDGEEKLFPLPDQPCPPVKPRRRAGREDHGGGGGGCSSGGRGW